MTPQRYRLIRSRLEMRQPDLTVLMDRVHKPHNFSAVLRSCDAVGVHRAHAVPGDEGLPIARSATQGTHKWVYVQRHSNIEAAFTTLRDEEFRLFAADPGPASRDFRDVDYTRPTALILGTEKHGVSPEALANCDERVNIPMQGMVESLNVSVAAAILLFEAQRQRMDAGMYERSRLDEATFRSTLFDWLHPRIARYCREKGLDYPELDDAGNIVGRLKGMASDPWEKQP